MADSALLLSDDDLIALTDVRTAPAQIKWLAANGVKFKIGATGRPKVARAEFDRHMIGAAAGKARRRREPNFEALQR